MSRIKAVLFDLDGTLINTITDLANATNYTLNRLGFPTYDTDSYRYRVGNGMRKLIQRALPDGHKDEQQVSHALGIFMEYYNQHALDNTTSYNGVPEVIAQIRSDGIKTAVVTNKAEPSAHIVLDMLYPDCFDVVVGQREGMPVKPDPTGAKIAMGELGVTPDECVFVGDSGVDILTAANSGAYPVGVLWGFREREELLANGAKSIISSPGELIDIISNL